MSTSPDTERADDQLVTHMSHWLTRQIGNDELLRKVEAIGTDELTPSGREAPGIAELEADRLLPSYPGRGWRQGLALRARTRASLLACP